MKTWKNKLSAIAMLGCGYVGVLLENDVFFCLFYTLVIDILVDKDSL